MYSSKNASAVQDELQLLDGIFNQIIEAVTDSKEVFEDAEYKHVEDWFDEINEKLCTFKRKVHNWLKDAMKEMEDKKLSSMEVVIVSNQSLPRAVTDQADQAGHQPKRKQLQRRYI